MSICESHEWSLWTYEKLLVCVECGDVEQADPLDVSQQLAILNELEREGV
jgi:hypothetical protein